MQVKKITRVCFQIALVVFSLCAIALLAMNLYVQSAGVQLRLIEALEEAVGAPVTIQQTSVTPWNGISLEGVRIASAKDPSESFLKADLFSARVSFPQLLHKKIVIKQIKIQRPKMVWQQASDGRWHLPGTEPPDVPVKVAHEKSAKNPKIPKGERIHPVAAATVAAPAPLQGAPLPPAPPGGILPEPPKETPEPVDVAKAEPPAQAEKFEIEIRRVRLNEGDFALLDKEGGRVCMLKGVDLFLKMETAQLAEGDVQADTASIRDIFNFQDVRTQFSYTEEHLDLKNLTAGMGGGTLRIDARIQPNVPKTPFEVETTVNGADLDQLIGDATGQRNLFTGSLEGELKMSGHAGLLDSHDGSGVLRLVNGGLQEIPVLKSLGSLFKIDELQNLNFTKSEVNYRIRNSTFFIEPLLLESENLRLVANGEITYAGEVSLHAKLYASNHLTERLPSEIRASFTPDGDSDYGFVAFEVSGSVDRLETDLADRLIPKKLRSWYDGMKGLKELF